MKLKGTIRELDPKEGRAMNSNDLNLYSVTTIRQIEKRAKNEFGLSSHELMGRAAKAAWQVLQTRFDASKLVFFCGSGNNGGDGYVLAQIAKQHGLNVSIIHVGDVTKFSELTAIAYQKCLNLNIPCKAFSPDLYLDADLIIDALLGIGLAHSLSEPMKQAITMINQAELPVLSLDVPSGVQADTGFVEDVAVHAWVTISFIAHKKGLLTANAVDYCGEIVVDDLSLPSNLFSSTAADARKISLTQQQLLLPPRARSTHKKQCGHVFIIGGYRGMAGAARMAAEACMRVGAGLVTVFTLPDHVSIISSDRPEIMCRSTRELSDYLDQADVLVLGPGLGQSSWSEKVFKKALKAKCPMVIDADGLNLLARFFPEYSLSKHTVLTPHPAEAGRLLKSTTNAVQHDRFGCAQALQMKYQSTIVLKGAGTIVQAPNLLPMICTLGNPGMATAGMGDVLSGVIAGLMAQGLSSSDAATFGVVLHAASADAAKEKGERGMMALDLMRHLRRLVN